MRACEKDGVKGWVKVGGQNGFGDLRFMKFLKFVMCILALSGLSLKFEACFASAALA